MSNKKTITGYSFAQLGVRYPSRGGIVEYLVRAYSSGWFSGGCSILFYIPQMRGGESGRSKTGMHHAPDSSERHQVSGVADVVVCKSGMIAGEVSECLM